MFRNLRLIASVLALGCLGVVVGSRCGFADLPQSGTIVPRVIITFYDSKLDLRWRDTLLHQMAEMPLNQLGLILEPHDINDPMPDLSHRSDVRGILTWFRAAEMPDPRAYLAWASQVVDSGKRYVLIGELGFTSDQKGHATPRALVDNFLKRIGMEDAGYWVAFPLKTDVRIKDDKVIGYERPLRAIVQPFELVHHIGAGAYVYLGVHDNDSNGDADLVMTTANGGYAANGYTVFFDPDTQRRQWLIDPFAFLSAAFHTDDLPKADTTTLDGRRIYYSQVDGDGWRNVSTVRDLVPGQKTETRERRSIDLLIDHVWAEYPDLPVSVAPIAADLDPAWCGDEEAQIAARRAFALPQVEVASHTYSHPLDWGFFASGNVAAKEKPFLPYYQQCRVTTEGAKIAGLKRLLRNDAPPDVDFAGEGAATAKNAYPTPRSYAAEPYDLDKEITGARDYIQQFAPGKKLDVLQWSGNTLAYAEALRQARAAGLPALNGGDTRFDPDFPTIGWVAPIGRWDQGEWQIYASASNEETYTANWSNRFFGFRYLSRTLQNTEYPRRLKPIDVYYHVFSADKQAGLNAILESLDWVEKQEITPVRTALYARIADGFYRTQFVRSGEQQWRIENRGALNTIRFDTADNESVDFPRSSGIMGFRRYQGSLYVALDPDATVPVVALKPGMSISADAFLDNSRWPIHGFTHSNNNLSFIAQGFGRGQMTWIVPAAGRWHWTSKDRGMSHEGVVDVGNDRRLTLDLEPATDRPVLITLQPVASAS